MMHMSISLATVPKPFAVEPNTLKFDRFANHNIRGQEQAFLLYEQMLYGRACSSPQNRPPRDDVLAHQPFLELQPQLLACSVELQPTVNCQYIAPCTHSVHSSEIYTSRRSRLNSTVLREA